MTISGRTSPDRAPNPLHWTSPATRPPDGVEIEGGINDLNTGWTKLTDSRSQTRALSALLAASTPSVPLKVLQTSAELSDLRVEDELRAVAINLTDRTPNIRIFSTNDGGDRSLAVVFVGRHDTRLVNSRAGYAHVIDRALNTVSSESSRLLDAVQPAIQRLAQRQSWAEFVTALDATAQNLTGFVNAQTVPVPQFLGNHVLRKPLRALFHKPFHVPRVVSPQLLATTLARYSVDRMVGINESRVAMAALAEQWQVKVPSAQPSDLIRLRPAITWKNLTSDSPVLANAVAQALLNVMELEARRAHLQTVAVAGSWLTRSTHLAPDPSRRRRIRRGDHVGAAHHILAAGESWIADLLRHLDSGAEPVSDEVVRATIGSVAQRQFIEPARDLPNSLALQAIGLEAR